MWKCECGGVSGCVVRCEWMCSEGHNAGPDLERTVSV